MDSSYKALARPGYLLAVLLVILPIADSVMSVWPLRFEDERWRYGAVGAFSNITLVPLMGLFIGVALATVLDHRRTRKFIGWLSALAAVFFGAVLVVFILDYFQTRAGVQAQYRSTVDVATYTSIFKQTMTVLALTLLSGAGLRGPKPVAATKAKVSSPRAEPTPLIITTAPEPTDATRQE
jgi:uncharacterized membrane protein YeaQ/YmgE (transglycosylase-associated protein family)